MKSTIVLLSILGMISSCSHHPHHPPAVTPGTSSHGLERFAPLVVGNNIMAKSPHLAISARQELFVAVTNYDAEIDKESISIYPVDLHSWELGTGISLTSGKRAWGSKMIFDHQNRLWLTWCGLEDDRHYPKHTRHIYLKMVHPFQGVTVKVSTQDQYNCGVDFGYKEGELHFVWESDQGILYRSFNIASTKFSPVKNIAQGWKNRRPVLAIGKQKMAVVWDRWVDPYPTGLLDPDYDVVASFWDRSGWGPSNVIDNGAGIQAAPSAAFNNVDELVVAYHTNDHFPLVKFWTIRKLAKNGQWLELKKNYPDTHTHPESEVQGAEFPTLVMGDDGQVAIISRPSHGHYLHFIDGEKVTSFDLTRAGWGARDLFAYGHYLPSGELLVVRRARQEVLLEKIHYDQQLAAAKFTPVTFAEKQVASLWQKQSFVPVGISHKKIMYGDVHQHSGYSDGTGSPDEIYARSYARGLDFSVLTDHDNIVRSRMFPSQHMEIAWVTDKFNQLEGFSTLHGYEWTTPIIPHGHGHRNIYFKQDPPIPLYNYRGSAGSTKKLYEKLKKHQAFTAPHHTGWTGTDWEGVDPKIQRHVEITSVHGAYEDYEDNPFKTRSNMEDMFARNFLREGHEFGFIAGSDGHGLMHHHGIGRHTDPWAHGLSGVYAKTNEREAIWDALYRRENFATSGPIIGLYVNANGHPMGSEWKSTGKNVTIDYQIKTTGQLLEVKIIKDGSQAFVQPNNMTGSFVDKNCNKGRHSYYIRVVQQTKPDQKDMAWTSPVFITCGQ